MDKSVGQQYEVTRAPDESNPNFPQRIAYLIDPDGMIRKAYQVGDVNGFAAEVLGDLETLRGD
jgi:peroxiredoxin